MARNVWKWGEGKRGGGVAGYKEEEEEGGSCRVFDLFQPPVGQPEEEEELWKEEITSVLKQWIEKIQIST